jgi:uncharacterized protein YndB with AHSA1/START domain
MSNGTMEGTALRLERLIPSPPEVLFAFWTEPAKLLTWWGPDGYEASVHSLDTKRRLPHRRTAAPSCLHLGLGR